jgi:hypothetical protein
MSKKALITGIKDSTPTFRLKPYWTRPMVEQKSLKMI